MVALLMAAGWLFLAPNDLAAMRLLGVALAWWVALLASTVALIVLALGARGPLGG